MKLAYFKNMLEQNKNNMKNTWDTLKKAIGKVNNKTSFPQSFIIENNHITDKPLIAESFNDYFSNIGKHTSQNVPKSTKQFHDYLVNQNAHVNSMFLEPINSTHVLDIVKKLKPKTSFGHEIPTKVLKESIVSILNPITHIINLSLITGKIPTQLKVAKVISFLFTKPQITIF